MVVKYAKQAETYLDKQTERQAARIKTAVSLLPAGDVRKLKGIENGYRLRVGNVRVLFERDGGGVRVVRIDSRGDVYK
ncbi:MAG: type II toxin-antitoxin system RelE/ParE family toxin [Acidobacteriota bacterium]|jgi:mRNA interferase RelE/StbE|nr:type II toxin-antitoxin system RelE/ParE family toxin [Acidobacteriota bacterium]